MSCSAAAGTVITSIVLAAILAAGPIAAGAGDPASGPSAGAPGEPPPPAGVAFAPPHPAQALAELVHKEQRADEALRRAQAQDAQAQTDLEAAQAQQAQAVANLEQLQGRQYQAAIQLVQARDRLRRLAVDNYVSGGTAIEVGLELQAGSVDELSRRQAIVGVIASEEKGAIEAYRRAEQQASGEARPAADAVAAAQVNLASSEVAASDTEANLQSAKSGYDSAASAVALAEIASPAPGSDIPRIVLQAYQHAQDVFAVINPSCHLSWADLAALGRIESGHAQDGDTRLAANGDTYPPILGPPLDGANGNAALAKPPTRYYDGPGPWEEALGPMQFLPTSWDSVAMVGGSNVTPDPNNVFDAAMSAANYLCQAVGPNGRLDTLDGLRAAFFSYNHSNSYVAEALSNAEYYGAPITPSAA